MLAASALLGRPVDPAAARDVSVPGRLDQVGDAPLELWDGAHNVAGVDYLLARLPEADEWTIVVSILADKDADSMLAAAGHARPPCRRHLVGAPARARGRRARAHRRRGIFPEVETVTDPAEAVARARTLAGPSGAVLVTGSLTLIARLAAVRPAYVRWVT